MESGRRNTHILSLFVVLLSVSMLTSCASFSDLIRSSVDGIPLWVRQAQIGDTQASFVGKGEDTIAFNARLAAYEDILSQLSDFLGDDIHDEYYRELTTTDAIADFNLRITHEFSQETGIGKSVWYLMATALTEELEARRTAVYNATLDRERTIADFVTKAETAYRGNRDLEAADLYASALLTSAQGSVDTPRYAVDTLLDRYLSIISALRFSLDRQDPAKATCMVFLRRKSRLLAPRVHNATIKATFMAENSEGKDYEDTLFFNTASNGSISFRPYNHRIMGKGTIVFGIDIDEQLEKLETVLPVDTMERIVDAADGIELSFPYALERTMNEQKIMADVLEYDVEGHLRDSAVATSSLLDGLSSGAVTAVETTIVDTEDESELSAFLQELGRREHASYAILGKVGIGKEVLVEDRHAVVVSGYAELRDLETDAVVGGTGEVEAVAFDTDLPKARDEAFRRFGMTVSSLLMPYFH